MKIKWRVIFVGVLLIATLGGCSMPKTQDYQNEQPALTMASFFSGHVTGYGMVQDRSGKVNQRFVVDMHGEWNDNKGILKEDFVFADGHTQKRQWNFRRVDNHTFLGTAADVIGEARCEEYGNTIHMLYVLQVPVSGKIYNITMDDWLYAVDSKVVLNRTSMKKFGIQVGSVTSSFMKHD